MAREKKFLDTNIFTYAIQELGKQINKTFLKKKDEITETRIDEIMVKVFDEEEEQTNG